MLTYWTGVVVDAAEGSSEGLSALHPTAGKRSTQKSPSRGPSPTVGAGEDPKAILDDVAKQWDALTERIGVDKQREAYLSWSANAAAYPSS